MRAGLRAAAAGAATLVAALVLLPDTAGLVALGSRTPPVALRACACRPDSTLAYVREDGLRIAADLYRPPGRAAAAVLLLHGNTPEGGAHPFFRVLARGLADSGRLVLVPDLAGYGDSADPLELGTPAALERRLDADAGLRALRERLPDPATPVHVVGHSRGGVPALEVALRDAGVESAVAIGPSRRMLERMDDPADVEAFWEREVARSREIFGHDPPAWFDRDAMRASLRANALETVAPGLAAPGHPPVLFVEGGEEPAADRAYLAAMVRGFAPPVEHVVLEGADHYVGVGYGRPWTAGDVVAYDGRPMGALLERLRAWTAPGP